jgi:hypothetical protein
MIINYNKHIDYIWIGSQDSILRLWAEQFGVQFLGGSNNWSLLQNVQTCSGAHPASYSLGTGVLLLGINQPQHEANHSPPSSLEVKNEWSCTSASPICLYGIHRDNITFHIWIVNKFNSLNYYAATFKSETKYLTDVLILISGFRRDVDEICGLLGNYTALCGNYLPSFRDNVSVPSSRVKSPWRWDRYVVLKRR